MTMQNHRRWGWVGLWLWLGFVGCSVDSRELEPLQPGAAGSDGDAGPGSGGAAGEAPVATGPGGSSGESGPDASVVVTGLCNEEGACLCDERVESCGVIQLCDAGVGCACAGCNIDGDCIAAGAVDPENPCQICDPA